MTDIKLSIFYACYPLQEKFDSLFLAFLLMQRNSEIISPVGTDFSTRKNK